MALVLLLLLAGCSGSKVATVGPTTEGSITPPEAIPEDAGDIDGIVLDDEKEGVPEVRVEIRGPGRWTISDAEGKFHFDFVAAGHYELEARLRDFSPVVTSIQVASGEKAFVEIHTSFPPVTRPYHQTLILKGHLGCNAGGMPCPGYSSPNEKAVFNVPYASDEVAIVAEITWTANVAIPCVRVPNITTTPCLNRLHAWLYYQSDTIPRQHLSTYPPYLRIELAPAAFATIKAEGLRLEVKTDFAGINYYDPGIALEQEFTVYLTTFHMTDGRTGFTAVPPS